MGSDNDNFFKKKRAKIETKKIEFRNAKPNSYLIVTEGKRTEPLYMQGLANYIIKNIGGNIDVFSNPYIKIEGEGRCTVSLVEKTKEVVNRSKIIYENVWVVFDKDDFSDFDKAIDLAEKTGFKVAWSNQSFEYWLYLHFNYSDAALHRDDWVEKLTEIFKENNLGRKYEKNNQDIFLLVTQNGGLKSAVANAKRIMANYNDKQKPSQCDPATTVYRLIQEFEPYLEEFYR